jgi:hypothetical protein
VERISEGKPVSVKLAGIIIDIVTHMAPAKQWLGHCNNERPHKANGGFPLRIKQPDTAFRSSQKGGQHHCDFEAGYNP